MATVPTDPAAALGRLEWGESIQVFVGRASVSAYLLHGRFWVRVFAPEGLLPQSHTTRVFGDPANALNCFYGEADRLWEAHAESAT